MQQIKLFNFTQKMKLNRQHKRNVKKFTKFLKENNAYREYMTNLELSNKDFKSFTKRQSLNPDNWLVCPFIWDYSTQSQGYWYALDVKWNQLVENN